MTIYEEIVGLVRSGKQAVLVTVVETAGSMPRGPGSKMLVRAGRVISGSIGGGSMEQEAVARASFVQASGAPLLLTLDPEQGQGSCGGRMTLFLEPLGNEHRLLVVGYGHVGRELVRAAAFAGYQVQVFDDRLQQDGDRDVVLLDDYLDPFVEVVITVNTGIVICTRSHEFDLQVLRAALGTDAGFIGLLGSRRKKDAFFATLRAEGVGEETLERVHVPVGLDIGAETPAEIAIAVMAQLIREQRRS